MKILLSNDDGVHAEGIRALKDYLSKDEFGHRVVISAPSGERSTTGHGLSIHEPLWVQKIDEDVYGCSGLPADSAYVGITHVMDDDGPDYVISGINYGGNMGQDIYYSGTCAAAREAIFRGTPALAISLCTEVGDQKELGHVHFETAARVAQMLIENNVMELLPENWLLNVNVPNLPYEKIQGFKQTKLGFRNYTNDHEVRECPRGRPYIWNKSLFAGAQILDGTDCEAIEQGFVSLTALNLIPQCSDMDTKLSNFVSDLK